MPPVSPASADTARLGYRDNPRRRVVMRNASSCQIRPLVIAKYWCSRNIGASSTPIGHAKPIITDGKRVSSGHMGMWLINLLIAIAAWIAVCAAIIKLVEALP